MIVDDADAGALRQFISFARMSGLDLDAILDDELRAIAASAAHAARVPAHAIVDMLQICAAVAGRPGHGHASSPRGNIRGYGHVHTTGGPLLQTSDQPLRKSV